MWGVLGEVKRAWARVDAQTGQRAYTRGVWCGWTAAACEWTDSCRGSPREVRDALVCHVKDLDFRQKAVVMQLSGWLKGIEYSATVKATVV